jgi:hypothetical protein
MPSLGPTARKELYGYGLCMKNEISVFCTVSGNTAMSNVVEYILNIYSLWLKFTLHKVVSYASLANIMQNYGCIMCRVCNCPMEFWLN